MRQPRGRPPSPGRDDLDREIRHALFGEWWKSGNRSGGIRRAARQLAKDLAERQPPLHISPERLRSRFYEIVKDMEIDDLRRSKRKLVR